MEKTHLHSALSKTKSSSFKKNPLNVTQANRKIWLVKVPKWIAQSWRSLPEKEELGKMTLTTNEKNQPDIQINLPSNESTKEIPKQLKLSLTNASVQNMVVFSEETKGEAKSIEGSIQYEAALTPVINDEYRRINKLRVEKASQPIKQTMFIDRDELARRQGIGLGPSSSDNIFARKYLKGKSMDNRRERIPKEELIELLLTLFRQHTYWNMKGLKDRTEQPESYLREVLTSVALLNKRGPYAGMWSIRPELKESIEEFQTDTMENPETGSVVESKEDS